MIADAIDKHDFPGKLSEKRIAAMVWHITEHNLQRLEELMIFVGEELSEMLDEAWEATEDAEG